MKKSAAICLAALAACALTGCALTGCASGGDKLNVFAASSTRVLNHELEAVTPMLINNGGSASLVEQIHQGAPADVLLTASQETMDKAVAAGDVEQPRVLATNSMVMVVPPGNPGHIHSVHDLDETDYFVRCDPSVPCGAIADKIMADQHLHVSADSKEGQVADVVGKVASGEADAGWVYSTDAAANPELEVIPIEGAEKFHNQILGAVVKNSPHQDAASSLLDRLANDFDETWSRYGFVPAD